MSIDNEIKKADEMFARIRNRAQMILKRCPVCHMDYACLREHLVSQHDFSYTAARRYEKMLAQEIRNKRLRGHNSEKETFI